MNNSLLPPNATPQEVALAESIARISDVPTPVRESWDPMTCPVALLPWLAWAHSVDEWDASWTEAEKRGVIAASIEVHRRKGTIGAVRKALQPLGFNTDVKEWYQQTPAAAPFTFTVELGTTYRPITEDLYPKAERLIRATKNERSQLTNLRFRADISGTLRFGAVTVTGDDITVYPYTPPDIDVAGPLCFGGVCQIFENITVGPQL